MADPVQLTDLDVITRYSIAVRKATADRDELIETLRADLSWLERGLRRTRPPVAEPTEVSDEADVVVEDEAAQPEAEAPRAPIRRMPAKVTPVRRTASKKAAAKPATKQSTTKRAAPGRSSR
jgi:hypothetical protein